MGGGGGGIDCKNSPQVIAAELVVVSLVGANWPNLLVIHENEKL